MSSAGHILDMIKRIRQNRSLRPSNRQKFQGDNRETIYSGTNKEIKASFKKFPESQVKAVIRQIKIKAKAEKRKELISLILVGLIVTIILIYPLITSNSSSENHLSKTKNLEYKRPEPIVWNGKISNPLNITGTNSYYVPVVREIENEIILNGSYTIEPPNMVGEYAENIVFIDKDCVETGKLLKQNGSIYFMFSSQLYSEELLDNGMIRIIYLIAEEDTNNDDDVNKYDRHSLYISEANGSGFTKITDRKIGELQMAEQGKMILMKFDDSWDVKDSLYGCYDIMSSELFISLEPNESN